MNQPATHFSLMRFDSDDEFFSVEKIHCMLTIHILTISPFTATQPRKELSRKSTKKIRIHFNFTLWFHILIGISEQTCISEQTKEQTCEQTFGSV